jgi:hypothetical protein
VILLNSSCSLIYAKPLPIDIPPAPVLAVCPEKPDVVGTVSDDGQSVILPAAEAKKLAVWIHDYIICTRSNDIDRDAYAQKLINRLKAIGGK